MAKTKAQLVEERKGNEYKDLMQLSQYSPLIKIRPLDAGRGRAPTKYEIVYTCRGYVDRHKNDVRDRFVLEMELKANYPYELPDFHCVDPPHIDHPHILGNWVCIGHQTNMPLGLPLRQYVIGVGEMIQWRKATDGRGGPLDTRPLVGREPDQPQPQQPSAPSPTIVPPPPKAAPATQAGRIVIKPQPSSKPIVIKPEDKNKKS